MDINDTQKEKDLTLREKGSIILIIIMFFGILFGLTLWGIHESYGQELKTPEIISENYEIYDNLDGTKTLKLWQNPKYDKNFFTGQFELLPDTQKSQQWIDQEKLLPAETQKISSFFGNIALADSTLAVNSADSTLIDGAYQNNNYGSIGDLYTLYSSAGVKYRTITRWNLPNISGTITSASISIKSQASGYTPAVINLHEMTTTDWVEAETTWIKSHTSGANHSWNTAGGDYSATVIDSATTLNSANFLSLYLKGSDATNPMATLSFNTQIDLEIKLNSESGSDVGDKFYSKEAVSSANRPYLTIVYTPTTSETPPAEPTGLSTESVPLLRGINVSLILLLVIGVFDLMRRIFIKR